MYTHEPCPKLNESIKAIYNEETARQIVLRILPNGLEEFEKSKTEKNFLRIVKTEIVGNHRDDELQKRTFSKFFDIIYKEFKFGKITKEEALSQLKGLLNLTDETVQERNKDNNLQIFDRMFMSNHKGLFNDVTREIIRNPYLKERLNTEFLDEVVKTLNVQTTKDIHTNLLDKFRMKSLSEILNSMVDENGNKAKCFKLPWTYIQNIESMSMFLKKLKYRATHEKEFKEMADAEVLLETLISYFDRQVSVHRKQYKA